MKRRPRVLNPLLALVLGLALLGGWHPGRSLAALPDRLPGGPAPRVDSPPAEAALTPSATHGAGVQVTMPPVGLSLEYPVMAHDLGTGGCPPPALVAELLQLGSPPLSLAGVSQDMTAPSEALAGPPSSWGAATLYALPVNFWSQLHCLLSAARDPLTVGLNAKTGEVAWAAQMVAGARSAATSGLDFSLGNEPDLYYLPNYSSPDEPQPGEEADRVNLYLQAVTSLRGAVGEAPLIGPELARAGHWRRELPRVIKQLSEQTVGVHMYPLSACAGPKAVTVRGLLSAYAADAARSLSWVVADANAAGVPAIISEANSASCGGAAGVSDSPAAAVWAVRFVLAALKTGFREVRFHASGDPYDPFIVLGQEVIKRPLESALIALEEWLPVGSSLHTVAGVRGLVATSVSRAAGETLVLDNEGARAQPFVLRDARSVRTEALTATRSGLQIKRLTPSRNRIKLVVAGNSVLAVSP